MLNPCTAVVPSDQEMLAHYRDLLAELSRKVVALRSAHNPAPITPQADNPALLDSTMTEVCDRSAAIAAIQELITLADLPATVDFFPTEEGILANLQYFSSAVRVEHNNFIVLTDYAAAVDIDLTADHAA